MVGHIDDTFQSTPATRTNRTGGIYVDGEWVPGTGIETAHKVTLQPATQREIDFLLAAGERVIDVRRVYVNDGAAYQLQDADTWTFTGVDGVFKVVSMDDRPWRTYTKIMVSRVDDGS
jgi:hypothetical protein